LRKALLLGNNPQKIGKQLKQRELSSAERNLLLINLNTCNVMASLCCCAMLLGELHKRPAFEQSLQSLHQKYQQLLKRVLWRGERQLGRLVSASGPLRRSGEERVVRQDQLQRRDDRSHSAYHVHCSPLPEALKADNQPFRLVKIPTEASAKVEPRPKVASESNTVHSVSSFRA
jgi:hypothetical protein